MSAIVNSALRWAVQAEVPNWLFVLALLTSPSRWTSLAVDLAKRRLEGSTGGGRNDVQR